MSNKEFYLYIEDQAVKVSEEVYKEFYRGERKERYFMKDLKMERMKVDLQAQTIQFIPSREDSYERLLEVDEQFESCDPPVEDMVISNIFLENLLSNLSPEEQEIIYELYYLDKTEREVSEALHIAKTTLRRKKQRLLEELRDIMKNYL